MTKLYEQVRQEDYELDNHEPNDDIDNDDDDDLVVVILDDNHHNDISNLEKNGSKTFTNTTTVPNTFWNVPRCAGCIGATVGCMTQGICLSTICGIACMYCTQVEEGVIGDISRVCGSVGVKANIMMRDMNNEHQLLERSKQLIETTWIQTKQWNEEYRIVESTKNCIVSTTKVGIQFTKEHKLVERTVQGVRNVLSVVTKEVIATDRNTTANQTVEDFTYPEIYITENIAKDSEHVETNTNGTK